MLHKWGFYVILLYLTSNSTQMSSKRFEIFFYDYVTENIIVLLRIFFNF